MERAILLLALIPPAWHATQTEQALLLPDEPAPLLEFGRSVAVQGGRAVVGARGAFGEFAYVFEHEREGWRQAAVVGGFFLSSFGEDVALDGERFLVGAPQDGGPGFGVVYARSGNAWSEEAVLLPSVATPALGTTVGLDGDSAVLGGEGRAAVFTREGGGWVQAALLLPPEPLAAFGTPVAISGGSVAVAGRRAVDGRGVVWLFERDGAAWIPSASLASDDATEGEGLGSALALNGDTLAAFSPGRAGAVGAVYVFERCGRTFVQSARLVPGGDLDALGSAFVDLALCRNTLVVGTSPFAGSGLAHVFERDGDAWESTARLVGSDAAAADSFGWSAACSERTVLVGANLAPVGGVPSGSVHVYGLAAYPRVVPYGGSANGKDTLRVLGEPLVGGTLEFRLHGGDTPPRPGAASFLLVAAAPDPAYPRGSPLPFGGELLVSPGAIEEVRTGSPWNGPADPARIRLPIPLEHAFVGRVLYCQGLLLGAAPSPSACVTEAALVEIAF